MKTKAIQDVTKRLRRERKLIADRRDALRVLRGDLVDLEDDCNDAIDSLDEAIGALSKLQ